MSKSKQLTFVYPDYKKFFAEQLEKIQEQHRMRLSVLKQIQPFYTRVHTILSRHPFERQTSFKVEDATSMKFELTLTKDDNPDFILPLLETLIKELGRPRYRGEDPHCYGEMRSIIYHFSALGADEVQFSFNFWLYFPAENSLGIVTERVQFTTTSTRIKYTWPANFLSTVTDEDIPF